MGGNGSFSKIVGKELSNQYTHIEYDERVMGHKILVPREDISHIKIPMNSHSENPIYLCGKVDDKTGVLKIETIAKYEKHKLIETIDIEVDKDGNFVEYSSDGKGSHSHKWFIKEDGTIGRKRHDKSNTFPISDSDIMLISKIIEFNQKDKKWNR